MRWDNATAESFNPAAKVGRVNRTAYPTREPACRDAARYIDFHYSREPLHSALKYLTQAQQGDDAARAIVERRDAELAPPAAPGPAGGDD